MSAWQAFALGAVVGAVGTIAALLFAFDRVMRDEEQWNG